MDEIVANLKNVQKDYLSNAPAQVRLLDAFLAFSFFTAAVQVVYMLLVGTFPFNSFLAGLSSCAGVFVFTRKSSRMLRQFLLAHNRCLAVGLRMQVTDDEFKGKSQQSAFADYILCNLVLFLVCLNFIG